VVVEAVLVLLVETHQVKPQVVAVLEGSFLRGLLRLLQGLVGITLVVAVEALGQERLEPGVPVAAATALQAVTVFQELQIRAVAEVAGPQQGRDSLVVAAGQG
jgi:hypothetical protein